MQSLGDEEKQVDYLTCFRADSIVKDCEAIRKALTLDYPDHKKKWSVLGQSFGGFCITTYLSFFPEGLKEAFLFGGLPPMRRNADDVYQRLYKRVVQRNQAYYDKFPEDIARVHRIVTALSQHGDTTVPIHGGEGYMTARRFLQLGIFFGKHGGVDDVHDLVLRADTDISQFGTLTTPTIIALEQAQSWDSNVIYALLHEPLYCQGEASNWAADRLFDKFEGFSLDGVSKAKPVFFTGEMIYSHMFDSYAELRKLKQVGNALAQASDWPDLYDAEQLKKNDVPVFAAVYIEDMYVDYDLSMETARTIKGCKTFRTDTMYHNAISAKTDEVLKELFKIRDDVID